MNWQTDERRYLHDFLTSRFTTEDLKTLLFRMGQNPSRLPIHDHISFAREIVMAAEREGTVCILLREALVARPDDWLDAVFQQHCGDGSMLDSELSTLLTVTLGVPSTDLKAVACSPNGNMVVVLARAPARRIKSVRQGGWKVQVVARTSTGALLDVAIAYCMCSKLRSVNPTVNTM